MQAVPFDDDNWPYETYANIVDYTLLMGYDEHWDQGAAGSIAGQVWFEDALDKRMRVLDPNRTIIAIGNYGYDWVKGQAAEELNFQEAVLAARDSDADIDFDPRPSNPHFSYIEDDGSGMMSGFWTASPPSTRFMPPILSARRLCAVAARHGRSLGLVGDGPALQRAGAPDAFARFRRARTSTSKARRDPARARASEGERTFEIDETDRRDHRRDLQGRAHHLRDRAHGRQAGKLALTFDDGPDPEWTPAILDILKAKNVRATFFVIGENAEANPGLVQRILAEGHEVGNHTFTHPNLADTPDARHAGDSTPRSGCSRR